MANFMVLLLSLVFIFLQSANGALHYSVADFGAKADGQSDAAESFHSVWASACASAEPATIYVPRGLFLMGQAHFQGPCKNHRITVRINGTLVAPANYESDAMSEIEHWISFRDITGVSVHGGVLDGQGKGLWACKTARSNCPTGAVSLLFSNAENVMISGLTSRNSQLFHIVIDDCKNVTVQGVKIVAAGNSPNTDGIHVQRSTNVNISHTSIRTGDDCISIGPGTMNLWIENIACGPGHGISIGSLGRSTEEAGVENVTVKSVVFTGTQNGLRIKSWARPSSGFVRGVVFQHAIMHNAYNPIVVDQNYCPHNEGCPNQTSGVKISEVTYSDIQGTSASQVAVKFDCSPTNPCRGIKLHDVNMTYQNRHAQASCKNVRGTATGSVVPPSCL